MALVSWHNLPIETVTDRLKTNLSGGLSNKDAQEKLEKEGRNTIETYRDSGVFGKTVRQFKSPLVIILLVAGIATLALTEWLDSLVIFIALVINVGVGAFQEERASKAFSKLAASQDREAMVTREGRRFIVPAGDVVIGDVVTLSAGSHVPADVRLIDSKELSVNEAALTGEWVSVEKHTGVENANTPLAEQHNMAWMGTLVSSGGGSGVVVSTGGNTQLGRIAEHLKGPDTVQTPIQKSVRKLAFFLSELIGLVVLIIFILGVVRGEAVSDMLLLAIAVAVSVIPEGMPAAVTVVLAIGMEKILSRGGLVRNLASAETLGATTVILTDKTGTLTQAKMTLDDVITIDGRDKDRDTLLEMAVLASDAFVERGNDEDPGELSVKGRPMERAIVLEGLERGITRSESIKNYPELDFLPFESERRYAASLHKKEGAKVARLHVSGSPEHLLSASVSVLKNGKVERIKEGDVGFYKDVLRKEGQEGKRFVGIAIRGTREEKINDIFNEGALLDGLTFMGLISFSDPLREDVPEAIAIAKDAGAKVYMLTGDGPETAGAIAKEAGIVSDTPRPIVGMELEGKSDKEMLDEIASRKVFSRVIPSQKLRVVRAFQERGEIVAMTGDGINDAPALRNADIGVAVGSGTEVAQEASDIILLNDSFSIIVAAIEEGRRIMDNLKKVVTHLLSTSFHEVVLIATAVFVGAPLPVLAVQILWVNIIEEGLLNFGFAFEPAEPGLMKRDPRKEDTKTILTKPIRKLILTAGIIAAVSSTAIFFILLHFTELPIEEIRTITFVILSLDSIFFAISLKSLHRPFWTTNLLSNKYLIFAISSSILILVLTVALPPLRTLLSLTPLSGFDILLLIGVGLFDLLTIEFSKKIVFRNQN